MRRATRLVRLIERGGIQGKRAIAGASDGVEYLGQRTAGAPQIIYRGSSSHTPPDNAKPIG